MGEPRLPRRLVRFVAAAAMVALVQTPAFAQAIDQYVSIVDQYAHGDENGALNRLAPDGEGISSAIVARMRTLTDRQVRSAVMLHTELAAVLLANARAPQATAQIGNAQRLLDILTGDTRRRGAARPFAIRWYAFVTNLYSGQGLFVAAFAISRDGWAAFPHAAEVAVASGAVYEMRATLAMSTGVFNPLSDRGYGIRRNFESAASEYQRALTEDPTFAFAYLHRGWVHVQLGDGRATADLESALRAAKDDSVRYLAHLFLGASAERHDNLDGARRHFEAAHQLGPFQTSAVALSRVETAMGHADRARAIAAAFAQLEDRAEDPWWNYQLGGFEPGAITWLRAEARRR
jgi:tetratricopeptide (TPR) repeat protein